MLSWATLVVSTPADSLVRAGYRSQEHRPSCPSVERRAGDADWWMAGLQVVPIPHGSFLGLSEAGGVRFLGKSDS